MEVGKAVEAAAKGTSMTLGELRDFLAQADETGVEDDAQVAVTARRGKLKEIRAANRPA